MGQSISTIVLNIKGERNHSRERGRGRDPEEGERKRESIRVMEGKDSITITPSKSVLSVVLIQRYDN